jgi:CBS domain-containing protein
LKATAKTGLWQYKAPPDTGCLNAFARDADQRGKEVETMETNAGTGGSMYGFLGSTVRQFMTRTVITVEQQTTMRELAELFAKHDFNAFPVVEDGKVVGIVSKFDFLRAFAFTSRQIVPHYNELMSRPAADVMTEAVVHVDPTSPLTRLLQLMVNLKTRSFPVLNADRGGHHF